MIVPFEFAHLVSLRLQPEQAHAKPSRAVVQRLEAEGVAFSYLDEDGHAVMCGGLLPFEDQGAMAWSWIGADAGPHMLALVRESRRVLASHEDEWPVMRALTLVEFGAGNRFLKDRKSTRLNSSHIQKSRMPSSA